MTVAMVLIFASCITAGLGLTFHSDLPMRSEERFFAGWVVGIVAFTLCGIVSTRLFSFGGAAVAIASCGVVAVSTPGWLRGRELMASELADLKRRLAAPLTSSENPVLLIAILIPIWVVVGRMFFLAYQTAPDGGIMVGHLATFSDWQAHLTYTASFAYSENTALNLPLAAGNNIGYHAGINYFAALLIPAGATLPGSLQISGAFTLFAFPGVMYSVGIRVFNRQAVALLGTCIFLFFGGWGFIDFFRNLGDDSIDALATTYTRLPDIPREISAGVPAPGQAARSWWNTNPIVLENPIVGHFFPQRPTLIGFPVVLLVLSWLYTAWTDVADRQLDRTRTFLFCGVLVGLVPFFNLFAFGTPLVFVGLWWATSRFRREWLYFLVPAVVLALPVIIFLQPQSSALEYPYNWVEQMRYFGNPPDGRSFADSLWQWPVFWFRNLGFFLPLLIAAQAARGVLPKRVAVGLLPLWVFFVVPNVIKPHPWNGNNTHYFIFVLLLGALPVAALLVEAVKRVPLNAVVVVPVIATLVLSGVVDVFATNVRDTSPWPQTAMDSGGVAVGEWARTTDTDSVFVIELGWAPGQASPHQHPVPALSGRTVVIGNDGWVFDLGIEDWFVRKDHSRIILEAGDGYEQLVQTYDVDYLVIGPDTRTPNWDPNTTFWEEAADVVYRHAGWTVYEV